MSSNTPNPTGEVNVAELSNAAQETLIHIELTKTYFSISSTELLILEEGATSIWKDITLASLGIGLPCCINAIIEFKKKSEFSSEVFWNSLIGCLTIALAIIFGILWYKSKNKCEILVKEIKNRPKYKMP